MMTRPLLAFDDAGNWVWDAIVLGAGPAGAIAARQLAASGTRTLLVEKKAFPRGKVCGACLNESALRVLESVGLGDLVADLGGIRLEGFQLGFRGRAIRLALPGGRALSRARFDAALVDTAVASGAAFLPESQGLIGPVQAGGRRVVLVQAGRSITATARVVLIATGLGQAPFQGDPGVRSHAWDRSRVGAGCSVDDHPDFYHEPMIFMAVGRHGYVGLVRVEGDQLNVAAAFARELIKDYGSPGTAAQTVLAEAGFPSIPALASAWWQGTVPLTRRTWPVAGERFFVLGDAAGYVEPFTGEGMAWAMMCGKAVEPLARRAMDSWDPALIREWTALHRQLVARRQFLCRGLAFMLRHPWLARTGFELAIRAPNVAGLMIQRVNTPPILSQTS
jgi:flavin-dependent dehydrogenase